MREKKSNKTAPHFSFFHGVILILILVLVSCHMVGGIYAHYISKGGGSGTAQVAKFSTIALAADDDNTDLSLLQPGVDGYKQYYVDFDGAQVRAYVFVAITMPQRWKYDANDHRLSDESGKITLGVANDWKYILCDDNCLVLCYGDEPLELEQKVENVAVFADGTVTVPKDITVTELTAAAGNFAVQAVAVQSGGFDSAAAAWKSVSGKLTD